MTKSNETIDAQISGLPRYIRPTKYAEISGITEVAQRSKRHKGVWLEGREYIIAPDGRPMVDWRAVDNWVEGKRK